MSVAANDDMHETAINWNVTSNTSYYDLRIWKSDGTMEYGKQNFSPASSPNALVILDAGSYTVNVASVNTEDGSGTWVYSDAVSFTVPEATRPEGATPMKQRAYNQKLYNLYRKDCTWREAKYIAEQSGGTIAAITTQGEQDVVSQLVSDGGFNAWIGAEAYHGYTWSWVSGEPWSYTNWASGEPNGSNGKENCAEMYAATGEWNDVSASSDHVHGFVAEFEPVSVSAHWNQQAPGSGKEITKQNLYVEVTFKDGTVTSVDDYTFSVSETQYESVVIIDYGKLSTRLRVPVKMSEPDFTLPASLKQIDEEAFANLPMTVVMLPEGLEEIGPYAFRNCLNLREIYIPDSVVSMDNDVFQGCSGDLTIFGHEGKMGEAYAKLYGIAFRTLAD